MFPIEVRVALSDDAPAIATARRKCHPNHVVASSRELSHFLMAFIGNISIEEYYCYGNHLRSLCGLSFKPPERAKPRAADLVVVVSGAADASWSSSVSRAISGGLASSVRKFSLSACQMERKAVLTPVSNTNDSITYRYERMTRSQSGSKGP